MATLAADCEYYHNQKSMNKEPSVGASAPPEPWVIISAGRRKEKGEARV